MTTITPLPTPAPSRDQTQAAFNSAANALFGALPTMVTQTNTVAGEINAAASAASSSAAAASSSAGAAASSATLAQDWATKTESPVSGGEYSAKYHAHASAASAATALNAPGTSATSTTSLTVGTGSKSLTIQTGKLFAVGQFVVIASTASPSNYMAGQITAHNSGTGALTVNVGTVGGSGTLAAWTVALGADSNALLRSGGTMTGALNEAKAADIASTATVNLDAATGNYVTVTGTTAITAITLAAGAARTVRFTGALTLTHGASLVLPGLANITTAAGDVAVFRGDSGGVVRCVSFDRASGLPVVSTQNGPGDHSVVLNTGNGYGSTNTMIRRFTTTVSSSGTAITYADSATAGASFTINSTGFYEVFYGDRSSGSFVFGISVNSSQLNVPVDSISAANRMAMSNTSSGQFSLTRVLFLSAGDIVRPHTNANSTVDQANANYFTIRKVGNA